MRFASSIAKSNPASGSRASRSVAIACRRRWGQVLHRVAQGRQGRVAERDQRPAEAQPRLASAAPELRRQRSGQLGLPALGHERDRRPPGALRHLVVGVGQQRPRDRLPRPRSPIFDRVCSAWLRA